MPHPIFSPEAQTPASPFPTTKSESPTPPPYQELLPTTEKKLLDKLTDELARRVQHLALQDNISVSEALTRIMAEDAADDADDRRAHR
jgi:hypothetical protein